MPTDFTDFQTIPPVTRTAYPEPPTARLLAWDVESPPPGLKVGDVTRVRYRMLSRAWPEARYYDAVVDSIAAHVGPSGRYRIMLRVQGDA